MPRGTPALRARSGSAALRGRQPPQLSTPACPHGLAAGASRAALAIAGPSELANNGVMADHKEDVHSLQLAYDDIVRERDRLRSARASVTRQLGPLPASAGIAISVVAALARNRVDKIWLIVALGLLGLIVVVGILFSMLAPYRRLRARFEHVLREDAGGQAGHKTTAEYQLGFDKDVSNECWLEHMVELERRIYGPLRTRQRSFKSPFKIRTLQDGFDAERTGLYIVQLLFVALITVLVVGLLGGR
jgi:hypothetical protein